MRELLEAKGVKTSGPKRRKGAFAEGSVIAIK